MALGNPGALGRQATGRYGIDYEGQKDRCLTQERFQLPALYQYCEMIRKSNFHWKFEQDNSEEIKHNLYKTPHRDWQSQDQHTSSSQPTDIDLTQKISTRGCQVM